MLPGKLNLIVRQGDTYGMLLTLTSAVAGVSPATAGTPIDLTGCSAEMQIRPRVGGPISYSLSSAVATNNGGIITLGGAAGTVALSIPPADSATLVAGIYDLRIKYPSGEISTYVAGDVTVEHEVTVWA